MAAILPPILNNATSRQLEQAVACNHTELFCQNSLARGGEIKTTDGLIYTYDGPEYQSMIAFPSLDDGVADRQLDEMMAWYGRRPNKGLGCWSLDPPRPMDLGVRLLARGFQDGWRPCWMALDLAVVVGGAGGGFEGVGSGMSGSGGGVGFYGRNAAGPAGLEVIADNHLSLDDIKDLPYTGREGAVSRELLHRQPGQAQQFVAILKGEVVGHSSVYLTVGVHGVAGLYDVSVVPSARGKGIGKALVSAAAVFAREKGYRYAVLNATGRRIYEQIGFYRVGDGFTWWLLP